MYPPGFEDALKGYIGAIEEARAKGAHEDQFRHIFITFATSVFRVSQEEVELEKGVKAARVRGQIDLLFRDIVFEFKRNLKLHREQGKAELQKYLTGLPQEQTHFGVLTDGLTFEVYVPEAGGLALKDEIDLKGKKLSSQEAFLWLDAFIFSAQKMAPTTQDMLRRFGATSPVFIATLERLGRLFDQHHHEPSLQVKFDEWNRLLAHVYGSVVGTRGLFLRHTYLSLLARLIGYIAIIKHLPVEDAELRGVVDGESFRKQGFHNVAENDFFAWPLVPGSPSAIGEATSLLRGLARHLSVYDLSLINEDVLKGLYQGLVDPDARHDLGEFYTPDWLAEHTLKEAGLKPGISLLDPACGSGTFLFTAIRLLREQGLAGTALVDFCRERVVGVDVHPLAVTIAKVNYLLALAPDLKGYGKALAVPIYMANSLLGVTPAMPHEVISIPTQEGTFTMPGHMAEDPDRLDEVIDNLRAFAGQRDSEAAKNGFNAYLKQKGLATDQFLWAPNLRLMRKLVKQGRDTIWAFILKNYYRPAFLRRHPFDLVAGNPPWLSYRYIQHPGYQKHVRGLVFEYGLLSKKESKLFTHMEMATLFYAFCADNYLKKGGAIALVMPRSVLTGAKQHQRFQEMLRGTFGGPPPLCIVEAVDLEEVSPLFNVPTCVLVSKRVNQEADNVIRLTLSGSLREKNAGWPEARKELKRQRQTVKVEKLFPPSVSITKSPYWAQFKEGATIVPRCLWLVQPAATSGVVSKEQPYLESHPEAVAGAKAPWKGESLSGEVEAHFLYATLLTRHLLPFGYTRLDLVVLPVESKAAGLGLITGPAAATSRGYTGLAKWLEKAEAVWEAKKKSGTAMTPYARLDYRSLLTTQRPAGVWNVLQGRVGTHLACSVLHSGSHLQAEGLSARGFVAEADIFFHQTESEPEAHYLCAVLNAPFVDDAIKRFQTQGLWGARHIQRRPFEVLPIPRFDPDAGRHLELAGLSRVCHEKVAGLLPQLKGQSIGRLRSQVRTYLSEELAQIDKLVKAIVG